MIPGWSAYTYAPGDRAYPSGAGFDFPEPYVAQLADVTFDTEQEGLPVGSVWVGEGAAEAGARRAGGGLAGEIILSSTYAWALLDSFGEPSASESAWAFTFDGHVFYVINLSDRPALVYDMTTGQWHSWFTREFDPDDIYPTGGYWNMFRGVVWNGRVLAADGLGPVVWEMDPHTMLDEGTDPIRRAVTAFLPLRGSGSVRMGALRLTARKEDLGEVATIRMRFSDDGGRTWSLWRTVELAANSYSKRIEWRSLGRIRAPGRLWEIEDVGGLVRIEGTDADLEGDDEEE